MADSFTPNLNLRKPEVGAANDTWGGTAGLNSDMDLLDAVFLATGLSTVAAVTGPFAGVPGVGLRIGVGMTLNVEGNLKTTADNVTLLDDTDPTKIVTFDASLLTTGTTRTVQWPDESGVVMMSADAQLLVPTGTVLSGYYGAVAPPGFVLLCGRSIGDAASSATERANADTATLFTLLWNLGFTPTTGGRGASAAADYAAHKSMPLPDHRGRVMAGLTNIGGTDNGLLPNSGGTTRGAASGAEKSSVMDGPNLDTTVQAGGGVIAASSTHIHGNVYIMQPTIMVDAIIKL